MAWLDDRIRDHPKIRALSASAFRWWAFGLTYCSEYGTRGQLDEAVKVLRVPRRSVDELVNVGLWDREPDGSLWVHDWQEKNAKRDAVLEERRRADRERQRAHRERVRSRDSHVTPNVTLSRDTQRDVPRRRAPTRAGDHDQDQERDLAAAANGGIDPAAAAALEELGIPATKLGAAWLELGLQEATGNLGGYVAAGIARGVFPSPRARASSGDKRPPAERRRAFVAGDGWRLEDDELEHQLARMGADASELAELLDLAADLRRERHV